MICLDVELWDFARFYLFIYIPLDVEFVVCVEKILTIVVFKVLYSGTYSGQKKKV